MHEHPSSAERTPSPKELAREKLRARAARIARMRKRVVAVSLATFALAFGVIAYDGSMGTTTSSTVTQTTAASSSGTSAGSSSSETTTSSSDNTTSSDDSGSSSSSGSASSSAPSAVTTRQS